MIRRPPRSTLDRSSAASDVYKRQALESAKRLGGRMPRGVEGQPGDGWVLVDFGDVVIHLFSPEKRDYYDLESLWHAGRVVVRMQ